VDGLAGLDHPGLARLGLAHGLGVDAGPLPHAGLGQPPGAVEVQLPVVLQHPHLPGQGQQPLRVGTLVHDHPAGARGQQPGGLVVVTEALDGLGGDDDLDADVADPLGQVDRRVHARGESRELVQDEQGVLALAGLAAGGVVAVVLQHHPHRRVRLGLDNRVGTVRTARSTSSNDHAPRSKAPARAAKKSA
jgi:hypothetical protein